MLTMMVRVRMMMTMLMRMRMMMMMMMMMMAKAKSKRSPRSPEGAKTVSRGAKRFYAAPWARHVFCAFLRHHQRHHHQNHIYPNTYWIESPAICITQEIPIQLPKYPNTNIHTGHIHISRIGSPFLTTQ